MDEQLYEALVKSEKAFYDLLQKLCKDGYIKALEEGDIAAAIIVELKELAASICKGIPLKQEDGKLILPDGYLILNRFDRMASEYQGAFWKNLQVRNPGDLTDMYEELLRGNVKILLEDENEAGRRKLQELLSEMNAVKESAYFD